jgi:hypothetical protein
MYVKIERLSKAQYGSVIREIPLLFEVRSTCGSRRPYKGRLLPKNVACDHHAVDFIRAVDDAVDSRLAINQLER